MKSKDYTYTLGLNGDRVADAYHVAALPTFYVISPDGKIAYSSIGAGSEEQISKIIQELLAAEESVVAHVGS